jgi:hypothetical protein
MSNVFSSNPVFIDTSTTFAGNTNWKGSSGGKAFTGGIGIRACQIILTVGGTPAAGTVTINEINAGGSTGPVLFQASYPSLSTADAPIYELAETSSGWHDFIVTIAPAASAVVLIYYRV